METTINQRIEQLINLLEKGKQASFAKRIDVSPSVINNIVAGRMNKPSHDVLQKIIESYADVDLDWLITGKGGMFRATAGKQAGSNQTLRNKGNNNSNLQAGQGITQQGSVDCEHRLAAAMQKIEHLEQMVQEKERLISIILSGKTGG